jgi:hypothetical protein
MREQLRGVFQVARSESTHQLLRQQLAQFKRDSSNIEKRGLRGGNDEQFQINDFTQRESLRASLIANHKLAIREICDILAHVRFIVHVNAVRIAR